MFHSSFHGKTQLIKIQRFGQVIIGPLLQGLDGRFDGGISRHDYHGYRRIKLFDLSQGFQTGDLDHPDIHQNQVKRFFMDPGDRRTAVLRFSNGIAPAGQQSFEHGAVGQVIIHHQNGIFRFHRFSALNRLPAK